MQDQMQKQQPSRRRFLKQMALAGTAATVGPMIMTRSKVRAAMTIGNGEHTYEVIHHYPQLPSEFTWQTTHNVVVDKAQNLYVIHEGLLSKKDHPSIFVFDPNGRYVRSFGQEFQGGGHGLELREEGGEEFLYVTGYKNIKCLAKLTLKGEQVWLKRAPMESGKYRAGEDTDRSSVFARDRFLPTNFAFLPDGGFLLADGYGSYYIHRYDKNANWVSCFGGASTPPTKGEGTFQLPHGICYDDRKPDAPVIVVADRANNTLQRFTNDFQYIDTIRGLNLPANVAVQGKLMLVPELRARLTILGPDNQPVAQLGDDVERLTADTRNRIRENASQWIDGKFITPHDACFDASGNIYVAEYVPNLGRVTKLRKVS